LVLVTAYFYICVSRMLTFADVCWRMLTRFGDGNRVYYVCVLIRFCMCPHTAIYVSSYY
jgi:hypothetical protein